MKKILITLCAIFVLLMISGCDSQPDPIPDSVDKQPLTLVTLSEEEKELLIAFGTDLKIIEESEYADTVTEMIYHGDLFVGNVFQIEGIFSSNLNNDSIPYVYRYLNNGGKKTVCGLPLMYLEKEIEDNAWISVSGIVNTKEINGSTVTVLEVVAIESLEESGMETLEWDGSQHNH